ncbi:conjugal transfer protein TraG [Actinoplanes sp. SE50]|uniref:type IV secretory system conjugative DNA transfer family protein n=1 Tax=unclassified Actinoplanes TaxID=2626549 RepID=UPI00023EBC0B|nr:MULTISPECIES: TraM recognition domain-containing protein [unclassified Actinoplanes]AEV86826.1 Conjugal transfer protein traG [Actinoplanes sp. SE50/110]ATO85223.1 conjugal transfer protein TraG [Actinoplanes sp. SE50]SLM02633.1 conjugal transfer protein TraG [Actinoplanes sp. SE50/110]
MRPVEPRGNAGGATTPWVVLGLCAAGWVVVWLGWLAGRLVAVFTGRPAGPGFGADFTQGVVHAGWARLWPGVSPTVVAVVYAVLLLALVVLVSVGVAVWQRFRPDAEDPLPALASRAEVAPMSLAQTAAKARRLRPSLQQTPVKEVAEEAAGVLLGEHRRRHGRGDRVYGSWEDVVLAVMAPRSGKTTALAVTAVLSAPGPALATSNKADLWATTATARAGRGRVWTFDPQHITHVEQTWWWNPLAAVETVEDAQRLADHFIQEIRAENGSDDFWAKGALDLLTSLILAAAVSGAGLDAVQEWLSDSITRVPGQLLEQAGFAASARALAGRQAGAPETREGIYETARTAAACLANPEIMQWVTAPGDRRLRSLDVDAFAGSPDTLYLLSKDGAAAAAPLVAGLTDQVLRAAVTLAEATGGRLDPPLLAVLDEAANICKIRDLPDLYSHFGSRGICPITILQSYRQGARVWGERGMDALWSAATVKLVGAGIDDARFAEDLSRLVGEHEVTVASRTRDGSGTTSHQVSTRRQRILEAAQIRALPKGTALLLATGVRVAMLTLLPWYEGPQAQQLSTAVAANTADMTRRAGQARAARRARYADRAGHTGHRTGRSPDDDGAGGAAEHDHDRARRAGRTRG